MEVEFRLRTLNQLTFYIMGQMSSLVWEEVYVFELYDDSDG